MGELQFKWTVQFVEEFVTSRRLCIYFRGSLGKENEEGGGLTSYTHSLVIPIGHYYAGKGL